MYKVIIIDDEPWSREVVKSLVAWDTMQLTVAAEVESGTEGLQRMEEIQPHIVITDMRMPGLDGVELLQQMQARFPSMKLIVMSGYNDFVYLRQAIRSRAVEYLLKPINPDDLNAALARSIQELDQLQTPWNTTHVFTDKTVLDRYLTYRRQVSEQLHDLDGASVLGSFGKLEQFLRDKLPSVHDGAIVTQIAHEFIVILEAFMADNDIALKHLWGDSGDNERSTTLVWNSVTEVFEYLGRYYTNIIEAVEEMRKNRNRLKVSDVQSYIDRHFQDAISLETVAQRFFISKEHLSRVFKADTGENLSDYILRKRMEKARELIAEGRQEIKHIALMTGYPDLAYFYKVFKKYYGLTPGELRKGGGPFSHQ
ncbi:hypothetical protein SD70_13620 [Gordoniibacillus kamchatkensis]|uniref:DNA-binding response regulator n=1 Tax=Gordoniibacillus kamchatkensis TaxID=1590651 RepID=A0ABR5AHF2_9BACL|nr:response regulator [Paenibacillus sp. VKM B-2647]KIL40444.1 hypothetical protein SD70_13620 [Paenibacillus sp. VKM B-2647]